MPSSPAKRRITAAERVAGSPRPSTPVQTSTARYRKYLLVPVVPVAALLSVAVMVWALSSLPRVPAMLAMVCAWIGTIVHASRRAKAGWVVATVLFWPSLGAYWVVRAFRLAQS